MKRQLARVPLRGRLSRAMKDHLYLMDAGLLFTSPWVVSEAVVRRYATIMLTARAAPFEVRVADRAPHYQALAIKPLTERSVRAEDVRLLSVQLNPMHPHFRRFRAIPAPGVFALERAAFAELDDAMDAAYCGQLSLAEAQALFDALINIAIRYLPKVKPVNPRLERAIELLHENPVCPLEELAAATGLSYGRTSQLFAETVGISLRSYQLSQKIYRALLLLPSGKKLTDIARATGFTDLAHMSHVFQQATGAPLTYFMNKDYVRIFWREEMPAAGKTASFMKHVPAGLRPGPFSA
jgi:AraC-like DNA-binding protein